MYATEVSWRAVSEPREKTETLAKGAAGQEGGLQGLKEALGWRTLGWGTGGCKAVGSTGRAGCGALDGNSRAALWGALSSQPRSSQSSYAICCYAINSY